MSLIISVTTLMSCGMGASLQSHADVVVEVTDVKGIFFDILTS